MSESELNAKLLAIFQEEGSDQVAELDKGILMLEFIRDQDLAAYKQNLSDTVNQIFGIIHTLKASAGSLGYANMEKSLHHLESFLSQVKKEEIKIDQKIITI